MKSQISFEYENGTEETVALIGVAEIFAAAYEKIDMSYNGFQGILFLIDVMDGQALEYLVEMDYEFNDEKLPIKLRRLADRIEAAHVATGKALENGGSA